MTRTLDLQDVCEPTVDHLDERVLAQERPVHEFHERFAQAGAELETVIVYERPCARQRGIALVTNELAAETLCHAMIRTALGAGPRRHANGEQVAAADFSTKGSALGDGGVVRQRERGRDDGAVAGALAKLGLRIDSERDQRAKDELNNAGLTDQFSTRDPQMGLDLRGGGPWGYATPRAHRRAHGRAHRRSDKKEGSFWSRSCGSRGARRPRRWPDGSDTRSYNGSQRCQKDVSKKMSPKRCLQKDVE
jgi:hypothetical protein